MGQNYVDWKRNPFIVLITEVYKYVLTQSCLDKLVEGSNNKEKMSYDKWSKANETPNVISWCPSPMSCNPNIKKWSLLKRSRIVLKE